MMTLTFLGELGTKLAIAVHGFERETAEDPWDANWLRCSICVEQGAFRGAAGASFTTKDFVGFLSELGSVIADGQGTASFHPFEEVLTFQVALRRTGQVAVSGKLRDSTQRKAELSFHLETDFPSLKKAHSELAKMVSIFSQRGLFHDADTERDDPTDEV